MKNLIFLLTFFIIITIASAHENDNYKHKALPPCHGWKVIDSNQRKCFLDAERKMCVNAIYNHGLWHISKPYKCEGEKNDTD